MWYSNFTNPDGSGKKVVKVMDADKRTAQKMADTLEETMSANYPRNPGMTNAGNMSCDAFLAHALESIGMQDKKNTCYKFKIAMDKLRAALPISRVAEITPAALNKLRAAWIKSGYVQQQADGRIAGDGVAGANRHIKALKTLMRWGEREMSLEAQNWDIVGLWTEEKGRVLRYTKDQHAALTKATSHPDILNPNLMRTLYMIAYNAGLRPGEARWLWRSDVQFYVEPADGVYGLIHIQTKNYVDESTGKRIIWSPKSENGKYDCSRAIPMNAQLAGHLKEWFAKTPGPWVLSDTPRPAHGVLHLSRQWGKVIKKADLPGILYTLRHCYASDLVAAGESITNVQKFMGHASVKTTEIYVHFAPTTSVAGNSLHAHEYRGPMAMMGVAA